MIPTGDAVSRTGLRDVLKIRFLTTGVWACYGLPMPSGTGRRDVVRLPTTPSQGEKCSRSVHRTNKESCRAA